MMPFIKRYLFTILSALSLLLCSICVLMGVRSNFVQDYVFIPHATSGPRSSLLSTPGCLSVTFCDARTQGPPRLHWSAPRVSDRSRSEANWWSMPQYHPSFNDLQLPYLLSTLLTAAMPVNWCWRRWNTKQRRDAGLCRICGYDLRASPKQCPECGTLIPADLLRKPLA